MYNLCIKFILMFMSKVNTFLLVLVLVLVGVLVFQKWESGKKGQYNGGESPIVEQPRDPSTPDVNEEDPDGAAFSMDEEYVGNNLWKYVITGSLPTPCHSLKVDVIVRESFPEQVSVIASILDPKEEVCIQVLTPIEESGSFQASEGASVEFRLE